MRVSIFSNRQVVYLLIFLIGAGLFYALDINKSRSDSLGAEFLTIQIPKKGISMMLAIPKGWEMTQQKGYNDAQLILIGSNKYHLAITIEEVKDRDLNEDTRRHIQCFLSEGGKIIEDLDYHQDEDQNSWADFACQETIEQYKNISYIKTSIEQGVAIRVQTTMTDVGMMDTNTANEHLAKLKRLSKLLLLRTNIEHSDEEEIENLKFL